MKGVEPPISRATKRAILTLAKMIRVARIEKKDSQEVLAQRLGVSRQTVIALEKGDTKVNIGTVFEAATIVGIPLFGENNRDLKLASALIESMSTLLPKRSGRTQD